MELGFRPLSQPSGLALKRAAAGRQRRAHRGNEQSWIVYFKSPAATAIQVADASTRRSARALRPGSSVPIVTVTTEDEAPHPSHFQETHDMASPTAPEGSRQGLLVVRLFAARPADRGNGFALGGSSAEFLRGRRGAWVFRGGGNLLCRALFGRVSRSDHGRRFRSHAHALGAKARLDGRVRADHGVGVDTRLHAGAGNFMGVRGGDLHMALSSAGRC